MEYSSGSVEKPMLTRRAVSTAKRAVSTPPLPTMADGQENKWSAAARVAVPVDRSSDSLDEEDAAWWLYLAGWLQTAAPRGATALSIPLQPHVVIGAPDFALAGAAVLASMESKNPWDPETVRIQTQALSELQ